MKQVPLCFRIALLVSLMGAWGPSAFSHDWRLQEFHAVTFGGLIFTDEQGLIDMSKSTLGIKVSLNFAQGVYRVEGSIYHPYGSQLEIKPDYEAGVQEASIAAHGDVIDFSIRLLNPLPSPSGRAILFSATPTTNIPLNLLQQEPLPAIRWKSFSAWNAEGKPMQSQTFGDILTDHSKTGQEIQITTHGFSKPVDSIVIDQVSDVSVFYLLDSLGNGIFGASNLFLIRNGVFLPLKFQVWFADKTYEEFYVEHPSAQVALTPQSGASNWEQYP